MNQRTPLNERGQALVMIALALVILFGFTALVIDGTSAYSDRRHAQNAADTSALAAALAIVRGNSYTSAAFTRAASNGYDNNGTTNVVEVYLCSDPAATCIALPTGAKPSEYVQVRITSHVKMRFAQILGKTELVNKVQAVTHATQSKIEPLFSGQAIVSLSKSKCQALNVGGGGTITVTGSGVFDNAGSPCSGNGNAMDISSNTNVSFPCYAVVGNVNAATLTTTGPCSNSNPAPQITNPLSTIPDTTGLEAYCTSSNRPSGNTSTLLNPGYYDTVSTGNSFPPSGTGAATMNPGIYCVDIPGHTFSLSGQTSLTGSNVLIYMKGGGISITSGSYNLSAISNSSNPYHGLLIAMATYNSSCNSPSNTSNVSIAGNNTSSFTGTILAPCSDVSISGGSSGTTTFQNQIIANTVTLTGGAVLNINYNASQQWEPPTPATIEVNQ